MDWQTWLAAWGPAAPLLLFMCKAFYDLVYKIIPNCFREIKRTVKNAEMRANRNHRENVKLQLRLAQDVENLRKDLQVQRDTKKKPKPPQK